LRKAAAEPPRQDPRGSPGAELPPLKTPTNGKSQVFSILFILGSPETGSFTFGKATLEDHLTCQGQKSLMHLTVSCSDKNQPSSAPELALQALCASRRKACPEGRFVRVFLPCSTTAAVRNSLSLRAL